jgi:OmpA-OmpF porin, OOP family
MEANQMNPINRTVAAVIAVAAVSFSVPSLTFAQDQGVYLGGGIGEAKAKEWCDTGGVAGVTITSCDNKATAWKIYGGYQINKNFAAELSYLKTDDFTATVNLGALSIPGSGDGYSLGIAALGILPVNQQFSVFGKIGIAQTDTETRATLGGTTVTIGDDGSDAHFGVGLMFNFTRNWGGRLEWERLNDSKIELLSVSVQYRF